MLAWWLGGLLLIAGGAVFMLGHLTADDKLPSNHWAGVRISATMRSDAAWYAGQRAAAQLLQAAGAVALLTAVVLLGFRPDDTVTAVVAAVAGVAIVGLAIVGAVRAARAAEAVPDEPA